MFFILLQKGVEGYYLHIMKNEKIPRYRLLVLLAVFLFLNDSICVGTQGIKNVKSMLK